MLTALIIKNLYETETDDIEDLIIYVGITILAFITIPLDIVLFPIEFIIALIMKIKRNKRRNI